jgi:hypothetical protein
MEHLPRVPASRVSLESEVARGSSGVVYSGLYHACPGRDDVPPEEWQQSHRVCLKVCAASCWPRRDVARSLRLN